MNSPYQ
jgi:hypothetical protein